jgi:hypothetical protein
VALDALPPPAIGPDGAVGLPEPMPILKALYNVMPDRVLAEGLRGRVDHADSGQEHGRVAVHQLDVQRKRA